MSSTTALSEILTNKTNSPNRTIGLNKITKPNSKKPQTNVIVDMLLRDYADLIEPGYKSWFAGKFYKIPFDQIHRFASEARQEGRDPRRLFAYKVAHA